MDMNSPENVLPRVVAFEWCIVKPFERLLREVTGTLCVQILGAFLNHLTPCKMGFETIAHK